MERKLACGVEVRLKNKEMWLNQICVGKILLMLSREGAERRFFIPLNCFLTVPTEYFKLKEACAYLFALP